ncbi:MAG: hypothetical protein OXN20_17600 [Gemmatimonadota bacterium]|nr:hypothetical protein [Gemmatimonadota bacterium]
MQHVFFKPWVGNNFSEGGLWSKKVLILGESHYQWDENIPLTEDLTIQCVQEQIAGGRTKAFWTNIVIALLNVRPSLKDKYRCWQSVAFYNYIQCSVGFGPRVRPSPEMWEKSQEPFFEVLNDLQPDCIIVLGYQLWDNLPCDGEEGPVIDGAHGKRLGDTQSMVTHMHLPIT